MSYLVFVPLVEVGCKSIKAYTNVHFATMICTLFYLYSMVTNSTNVGLLAKGGVIFVCAT